MLDSWSLSFFDIFILVIPTVSLEIYHFYTSCSYEHYRQVFFLFAPMIQFLFQRFWLHEDEFSGTLTQSPLKNVIFKNLISITRYILK